MTVDDATVAEAGRRAAVLRSALQTFAAYGYRGTSMDAVAQEARISRPGLYFMFGSKAILFRQAVARGLAGDLAAAQQVLTETGRPLGDRILAAFDHWAGRYVGPLARDIPAVVAANPDLLDADSTAAPDRFQTLLIEALTSDHGPTAHQVAQTLTSVSVGLKHQITDRATYLERMRTAISLLLPEANGAGLGRSPDEQHDQAAGAVAEVPLVEGRGAGRWATCATPGATSSSSRAHQPGIT